MSQNWFDDEEEEEEEDREEELFSIVTDINKAIERDSEDSPPMYRDEEDEETDICF